MAAAASPTVNFFFFFSSALGLRTSGRTACAVHCMNCTAASLGRNQPCTPQTAQLASVAQHAAPGANGGHSVRGAHPHHAVARHDGGLGELGGHDGQQAQRLVEVAAQRGGHEVWAALKVREEEEVRAHELRALRPPLGHARGAVKGALHCSDELRHCALLYARCLVARRAAVATGGTQGGASSTRGQCARACSFLRRMLTNSVEGTSASGTLATRIISLMP